MVGGREMELSRIVFYIDPRSLVTLKLETCDLGPKPQASSLEACDLRLGTTFRPEIGALRLET